MPGLISQRMISLSNEAKPMQYNWDIKANVCWDIKAHDNPQAAQQTPASSQGHAHVSMANKDLCDGARAADGSRKLAPRSYTPLRMRGARAWRATDQMQSIIQAPG